MLEIVNLLTFGWLALWALYALRLLGTGVRSSILFVLIFHFFFCGAPLLADAIFGKPVYTHHEGFHLASRDDTTSLVYCLYVFICPLLWWWTARPELPGKSIRRSVWPYFSARSAGFARPPC